MCIKLANTVVFYVCMLVFINKKRIVFTVMMAAESSSESFSESEENEVSEESEVSEEPVTPVGRKRRRSARLENYMRGKSRKAYRVNEDLTKSVSGSPHLEGVCPLCQQALSEVAKGFHRLRHQGTELKKRVKRLPHPKHPERSHYKNTIAQNEWIRANVFDSMGNYLFCQECVVKGLRISKQRLSRQRKVKQNSFQHPITKKKKSEVEAEHLMPFVVMPEGVTSTLKSWWETIPSEHEVDVRFPYERHGLCGCSSNNAKTETKSEFLRFVDENSQPNGRRLDSRNPTHYLLPRFTTISLPKKDDPKYQEKLYTSLVSEFNRTQSERGKGTISDFSAFKWLKEERPKFAIYPHKVDYCDSCAIFKKDIQAKQQVINRLRQSSGAADDIQQAECEKEEIESELGRHKEEARESLSLYKSMTEKCKQQWEEIKELEAKSRTAEEDDKLQTLKHTFTLILSADYQMNKLLPYWGRSPQPGQTYYLQKVTYDVFGIVDHREGAGHVYLVSEICGPKNTDHTVSYLLHYLKSTGSVPGWIKRVQLFLDNAGSTNKNQYLMGSVYEIVERDIFNFFRVSFMIAGHTKFAPDRLFATLAKSFYSADIFNEASFIRVYQQHSSVVFDKGGIVRRWRDIVTQKYSNLPGIRSYHDFLAVKNPGAEAVMKVRELCYTGTLRNTPMHLTKGYTRQFIALPTVNDTYSAQRKVRELSESKLSHLKQMCSNYIQRDEWHELLQDSP